MSNCGVAAKMFEALYEAGINIQMINTSEIRVSVLLDEEDVNRAVKAIHDKFFDETCNRSRVCQRRWDARPARPMSFLVCRPAAAHTVERGEAVP